jgi:predicted nucleic acid-binding Zn ribbon protein
MVAASAVGWVIAGAMLDNGTSVPFYEYKRQDGTTFEIMQKMVDPPLECDPETGLPVTRVFHPIAVHFKGKGFYNTDYGTKKRAREKDAHDSSKKKAEKSESSGGDSSKGESKSDSAKSETKSSSSDSSSSGSGSSGSSSSTSTAGSKPAKS